MLFVMILLSFLTIIAFEAGRFWFLLAKRGDSFFFPTPPQCSYFFRVFFFFFAPFYALCPRLSLCFTYLAIRIRDLSFLKAGIRDFRGHKERDFALS